MRVRGDAVKFKLLCERLQADSMNICAGTLQLVSGLYQCGAVAIRDGCGHLGQLLLAAADEYGDQLLCKCIVAVGDGVECAKINRRPEMLR